jgi:RNA polymerase sigma-70 factor (ECF subfamily)
MNPSGDDSSPTDDSRIDEAKPGLFAATHWSMVLAAGRNDLAGAAAALERLCRTYWYPIYAFIRRRGSDQHDAEDLTQAFFAFLLEKETLRKVDRGKGKFRTFLLAALTNFLANEWDKGQTLKRGGRREIVSLDETVAEGRYRREPVESLTPEKLFERRWASTVIEQVLARLKQEYAAGGKADVFAKLEPALTRELLSGACAAWAKELGMSEGAVKVALHRLRRRFGEVLRSEIAHTVSSPEEIDDEIRHLFAAIAG